MKDTGAVGHSTDQVSFSMTGGWRKMIVVDYKTLGIARGAMLQKQPRLFAIDVDGTLLTSRHEVTLPTRIAIARVRERGVEVLLASSRAPRALLPILRALDLVEPALFVSSQGALTGSFSADATLHILDQQAMPPRIVRPIVTAASAAGVAVNWYAGVHWYVSTMDEAVEREASIVGAIPEVRNLLNEEVGPDKLMLIAPTEDTLPLRALVKQLPNELLAQVSNPTYLEITRAGVDKGSAVRKYCESNGIRADDVVAIGDGPNDLGLFAYAGMSVAPANARPQVLEAATLITRANDDDGVAYALGFLVT